MQWVGTGTKIFCIGCQICYDILDADFEGVNDVVLYTLLVCWRMSIGSVLIILYCCVNMVAISHKVFLFDATGGSCKANFSVVALELGSFIHHAYHSMSCLHPTQNKEDISV